ncbi:MAG: LysM peptidoglycan-binding domain-containing protein [bacterium]|nr:LysM peptidoglycan-binding domain-containing protein [bacterium]
MIRSWFRRVPRTPFLLTPFLLLTPPGLAAQEEITVETGTALGEEQGYHVVRPGETLEDITAYYLGSSERWRENWRLNEEIDNPHLILPGQRLKVLIPRRLPASTARLAKTARRVEDQLAPHPWEDAWEDDLLKPRDGVRTFEGSSAELVFSDATHLVLTEQSLVILGHHAAAPRVVDRQQIEVVHGQADLESRPVDGSSEEFEIILGDATATPRPGAGGEVVQARTRRPDRGGAQLMVYSGESEIAAAGTRLTVPEGMGTSVPQGAPPSPPEELLAAPAALHPEVGSRLAAGNPPFRWQPVEGARSYTLEVCGDADCGRLVERVVDLEALTWRPVRLPVGELFWRITAVSRSGLDGYPSAPVAFAILGNEADTVPPIATLRFVGPQVGVDDRLVVGPGIAIEVTVADATSGPAAWTPIVDGEQTTLEAWGGPWSAGAHTASVIAVDEAGNRAQLEPVPFTYDPDPPVLIWGVEEGPELGRRSGEPEGELAAADAHAVPGKRREGGGRWSRLLWTSSSKRWLPMETRAWRIRSDKPYIVLRAQKKPVELPAIGQTVTAERGLWIHAVDDGCGVAGMSYQVTSEPRQPPVLVVEAVDALGNRTRVAWPLARGTSR